MSLYDERRARGGRVCRGVSENFSFFSSSSWLYVSRLSPRQIDCTCTCFVETYEVPEVFGSAFSGRLVLFFKFEKLSPD
ncbi:hypothetical protein K2173_011370 [Erythroxylum novogranatense]|uniref:Uncharacterized protein n=1 Tax=Erythroxylum novogranatense TaxID=1862640 RepID=A0AAV8S9J1_9ROSI|nr:hypothetical protein K2173_011370 [Erythroxylum novogranatense]